MSARALRLAPEAAPEYLPDLRAVRSPDYDSGPLDYAHALRAWACAAASAAAAYQPSALVELIDATVGVEPPPLAWALILARRVAWHWHETRDAEGLVVADVDDSASFACYYPSCVRPEPDGSVWWSSSVDLVLRPLSDDRWIVEIYGEHPTRREAAERSIRRSLGLDG